MVQASHFPGWTQNSKKQYHWDIQFSGGDTKQILLKYEGILINRYIAMAIFI
jgi:hypothetical protein